MNNDLGKIENFFFNDEIRKKILSISKIDNKVNLLEITGMGSQEIKHSNVLSWLFGDNNHQLGNHVFFEFLKLVYEEDEDLKKYFYLRKSGKVNIYRERENIDLLIEDVSNSKIFVIENKVDSKESKGQLISYENKVKKMYPSKDCEIYFIYLCKHNAKPPTRDIWKQSNYDMINDVLQETINNIEIDVKVKFTIESYLDLLKKRKIMRNKELEELCDEIWMKKEYRDALNILIENKPKIDERLIKVGEKYGTPLTLIREYKPEGGLKVEHEVILKEDGLLYFDNIAYSTPNTLINNGIRWKVNGKKGGSGYDDLKQFKIKNTGEKLSDKEFPNVYKRSQKK